MRSAEAIPNNPWPHDMSITVENGPLALLELLWVREAWGVQPQGDVPPLLRDAPAPLGRTSRADAGAEAGDGAGAETRDGAGDEAGAETRDGAWAAAWPDLWAACLAHAAVPPHPSLFMRVHATAEGSAERADLLRTLTGPRWRDRFGDLAFDDSFDAWRQARSDEVARASAVPLDASPERRALEALIPAWRAGLSTVITLPCAGEYARVVGASALLVTDETRADPGRYSAALATFR